MSFKVLWQWVLEVIYTLPLPSYVSLPFPRSNSTHTNSCLGLLTGTDLQSLSHSIPESWLVTAWNSIYETPQDTKLEKQSNHNDWKYSWLPEQCVILGGDAAIWGEVEAPISFPSEYREAWRFSFAEKLEVKGLQGAGEVRFSMLQAVVPPSSHHQEKQNPKSFTGSQVGTQFPYIPWGKF